jgi:hypothetical protein
MGKKIPISGHGPNSFWQIKRLSFKNLESRKSCSRIIQVLKLKWSYIISIEAYFINLKCVYHCDLRQLKN